MMISSLHLLLTHKSEPVLEIYTDIAVSKYDEVSTSFMKYYSTELQITPLDRMCHYQQHRVHSVKVESLQDVFLCWLYVSCLEKKTLNKKDVCS